MDCLNRHYKVNRYLLSTVGLWPYQAIRRKLLLCFSVMVLLFSLVFVQIAKFVTCKHDTNCILAVLPGFTLNLLIMVKACTFMLQTKKIKDLLELIVTEWGKLKSKMEIEIMEEYAKRGRRYSIIYAVYLYVMSMCCNLMCLTPQVFDLIKPLNQSRPIILLTPAEYFVDPQQNFLYIFTHLLVVTTATIMEIIATDAMFITYTEYAVGVFTLVGYRFEQSLYQNHAVRGLLEYSGNAYRETFADTVRMHLHAINFVKLLESIFTVPFIMILGLNMITISVTLIQVVKWMNQSESIKFAIYIFAQIVHLFILSVQGQKIINSSNITSEKMYNGLWYTLPLKAQRMLLLPLRRSCEPNFLSAGKIYVLSLQSFSAAMQASMSYFTMLASFT